MNNYHKLTGTYSVKISKAGNVILKNQHAKLTLKPETLRAFVGWLNNGCPKEKWLPSNLNIESDNNSSSAFFIYG